MTDAVLIVDQVQSVVLTAPTKDLFSSGLPGIGVFEGVTDANAVRKAFEAHPPLTDMIGLVAALGQACGEYAFAIADDHRTVHIVRSENGVVPLYHAQINGRIFVATDIKSLQCAAGLRGLGLLGPTQYLLSEYAYEPETLFEGVFAAPQGSILTLRPGEAPSIRRFSTPFSKLVPIEDSEEGLLARYRELVLTAIERRLKHHPAVFLSGGIDSNALAVYLMRDLGRSDAIAATYTVRGVADDEGPIAAEVARSLGMRHVLLEIDPTVELDLSLILGETAAPEAEASYIAQLSTAASDMAGCKLTLLAGQDHRLHTPFLGRADTLYLDTILNQPWVVPPIRFAASILRMVPGLGYKTRRVLGICARARSLEDIAAMRYLKLKSHLPGVSNRAIDLVADSFAPRIRESFGQAGVGMRSRFNAVMDVWWQGQGTWDGAYMRASARQGGQEAAMPYLDRDVVEFCARLPYDLISKTMPGRAAYDLDKVVMVNKYFLRKALINDLPERLLMRAKAVMPSAHLFMNGAFRGHLADLALPGGIWDTPVARHLDRTEIIAILKARSGCWEHAENPELWLIKNLMCLDVIARSGRAER